MATGVHITEDSTNTLTNKSGNISQWTNDSSYINSVARVDLTAQTAAKAATTLYAVPADKQGMYQISWVAAITTAATTSCNLGGGNSSALEVIYTSPTDSVVKTADAVSTNNFVSSTNAVGTTVSGTFNVFAKASTNIQYQYGYTSSGVTPMAYELHISVKYLGA